MRASASAPARHVRFRSIFGWYQISNQPMVRASSISTRGRCPATESSTRRRSPSSSSSIGPDQRDDWSAASFGPIETLTPDEPHCYSGTVLSIGIEQQILSYVLLNQPRQAVRAARSADRPKPLSVVRAGRRPERQHGKLDIDLAGFLEHQGALDGLALLERLLQAHHHDEVAARLQFDRLR